MFIKEYIYIINSNFAQATSVVSCADEKNQKLLGVFPKWYKYLPTDNAYDQPCSIKLNLLDGGKLNLNQLLPIGLSLIELLLSVAGVIVVGYIIYGGFKYVTSQGEPENTKAAQSTIINALIGGAIALIASVVVAFLGNRLIG